MTIWCNNCHLTREDCVCEDGNLFEPFDVKDAADTIEIWLGHLVRRDSVELMARDLDQIEAKTRIMRLTLEEAKSPGAYERRMERLERRYHGIQ